MLFISCQMKIRNVVLSVFSVMGNHAQGVAFTCHEMKIPVTILCL